jgi:shikimate dehydrogenase
MPSGVDMVVNASPVGMKAGDGLPGEIGALGADTLVGDVVVSATPTPMIEHATRFDCAWVSGRDMLAGQVDALIDFLAARSA